MTLMLSTFCLESSLPIPTSQLNIFLTIATDNNFPNLSTITLGSFSSLQWDFPVILLSSLSVSFYILLVSICQLVPKLMAHILVSTRKKNHKGVREELTEEVGELLCYTALHLPATISLSFNLLLYHKTTPHSMT